MWFDFSDDLDLIIASFSQQYGINLWEEKGRKLPTRIFINLCYMLNEKTPLGKIIQIRSCDDKEILKNFTDEQNKIRDDWRNRFNTKTRQEIDLYNIDLILTSLAE